MDWLKRLARSITESRDRLVFSTIAGEALALAALHRGVNLWGLPSEKPVLAVVLIGPALGALISMAVSPVWKDLSQIRPARWVLFAVPASLIAAALTWQLFVLPETQHVLTIQPAAGDDAGVVQISEIRLAYGDSVPLSRFSDLQGWDRENGLLVAEPPLADPLRVEFSGPVGELARISFITSPQSGRAFVTLDGQQLELNLAGENGNETRARLTTRSRWGQLDPLFIPLVAVIDWLAFISVLGAMWIAMELGQQQDAPLNRNGAEGLRYHLAGLIAVCAVALVLHTVDFLAVPLSVTKDSPSYLEGAAHWAAHGNLDGASSYRGPATTLLLGPAMMVFGRNPWGVKLVLHTLAFLCVPLAYRIGWQLQQRRWVAVTAALLAALSPDLYAYSDYVLSEGPDIFALLLYFTLLISALQSLSPARMAWAMLAGSLAVLVRTDNLAVLVVGFVSLLAAVWRSRGRGAGADSMVPAPPVRARYLALALVAAATPLIAWSSHNARVHGFFGLSEYGGAVLYDGWIYFGESAGIRIIDRDSVAAGKIDAVIPIMARGGVGPPTSWTVYFELLEAGYSSAEAFSLLGEAATDSIAKSPAKAARVLLMKLRQAPRPHATVPASVTAGGLVDRHAERTREFFDEEAGLLHSLGRLRDTFSSRTGALYPSIAAVWLAYSLLQLWLSSYRRPSRVWLPLTIMVSIVILVPTVLGLASWRYLLPGLSLLTPMAVASSDTLGRFAVYWYSRARLPA